MKRLIVHRGVESPHFPGLVLDSITFELHSQHTFFVAQNETNKLLNEYRYELVSRIAGVETWVKT